MNRLLIPSKVLLVFTLTMLTAQEVSADIVRGDLLGVFSGNDKAASILEDTGLAVEELARLDLPDLSDEGLSISEITFKNEKKPEPLSGRWDFSGLDEVDILVVKTNGFYAAYLFTDANTSNMRNRGLWSTGEIGNGKKGLSHLTAYFVIPEPSTFALATLGVLGLLGARGRRR